MQLKKLKIRNIRSYKEGEIDFPEGSTLLMGDIGSGKTSILLAIEFALFGLQPGQKGNSILRSNENNAYVRLEFEIDENYIVIERTLEKSEKSKSVSQAEVSISINNQKIEGSVTEIKNKILSLLSYPPEFAKKTNDLYKFTVYTPQEEMKQIILETSETRLNTLRHVFGIDKYKRIEENIDILTAKIRQEIRIKETEMGSLEQKKKDLEEKKFQLNREKKNIEEVENEIEMILKLKEEKQRELDELSKKINEKNKLENEKDKSELTLANKKETIENYEREIKNLKEQIRNAGSFTFKEEDIRMLKDKIDIQEKLFKETNKEYISIITSIQTNDSKIRELKMLKEKISALDKCPTCLQLVNDDYKKNIVMKAGEEINVIQDDDIEKKKNEEEISRKLDSTRKIIDSLKQSLSQLEIMKIKLEAIKDKEKRVVEIEKQKSVAFGDIEIVKKHILDVEQMIKGFAVFEENYEKKNKEFKKIVEQENLIMIKKAEINKEIQFLQKQILELENEIKRIEQIAIKLNYMKELEFWLNNKFIELVLFTERNVMLKLREDFSRLFSEWFSILVSDSLSVRLDEGFSPVIQQNDYEIDYNYLSGGERTAIALAYRLALNQTINSLLSKIKTRDIVILDEPTDGFSESQLDKMRDVFQQLKVKQLILVSHEPKIESFVDNIIRFRKIDGVSVVEK
jgi:exonuclease SbcC